jgi:FixJ family two-component response regulator
MSIRSRFYDTAAVPSDETKPFSRCCVGLLSVLFFTTLRTSYSGHTPHVLLFSWGKYQSFPSLMMVSPSKFQPSDEGGAAAANPVTTTTGSRRRAKEAYPNLSHKLPMEEGVIKEGVVFVVDYDASCRAALNELFESVGIKVKLYASGSAFLEDRFPDATSCIVLAVRLPGMSGLKIQGELARAGVHIPIIFLTGHGDIPMAVHAMKAGAVDFLTKPFRNQDLLDAVFTALEQDRARREKEESHSTLRQNFESLTSREREVIARVAAGDLNKQIAADLGVSEVTVKLHRANAMRKMRAKTVADLVRMIEHVND